MRADALVLRDGDAEKLASWVRSSTIRAGSAQRARIVLLAAEGVSHSEIADRLGIARNTVMAWRRRYQLRGLAGLEDKPRSGRPRTVDRAKVIAATLAPPPKKLGVTHWSCRLLAAHLKTTHSLVARAWAEHGIQPWRCETFEFSTDPELVASVNGQFAYPTGGQLKVPTPRG